MGVYALAPGSFTIIRRSVQRRRFHKHVVEKKGRGLSSDTLAKQTQALTEYPAVATAEVLALCAPNPPAVTPQAALECSFRSDIRTRNCPLACAPPILPP